VRSLDDASDAFQSPIVRLSSDGSSMKFEVGTIEGLRKDYPIFSFAVDPTGRLYQIVGYSEDKKDFTALVAFSSAGSYMWKSKFEFDFVPAMFLPLPAGDFLITGTKNISEGGRTQKHFFTGIFGSDAQLKRALKLPGDADVEQQMSKSKLYAGNVAEARLAPNGNIWLLRKTGQPRIQVLDGRGALLRVLELKAPAENARPMDFFSSGTRLLVVFQTQEQPKQAGGSKAKMLYGLFDGESGELITVYVPPEKPGILACVNGTELTFLRGTAEGRFGIARADLE